MDADTKRLILRWTVDPAILGAVDRAVAEMVRSGQLVVDMAMLNDEAQHVVEQSALLRALTGHEGERGPRIAPEVMGRLREAVLRLRPVGSEGLDAPVPFVRFQQTFRNSKGDRKSRVFAHLKLQQPTSSSASPATSLPMLAPTTAQPAIRPHC